MIFGGSKFIVATINFIVSHFWKPHTSQENFLDFTAKYQGQKAQFSTEAFSLTHENKSIYYACRRDIKSSKSEYLKVLSGSHTVDGGLPSGSGAKFETRPPM